MKKIKRESHLLKGYTEANPFSESQAKAYSDEKLVGEFFPTALFWSLFNEGHEILLGTRGSGKTAVLRMLSYSCLRQFNNPKAVDIIKNCTFVGFYIPMHLEFMASLPGKEIPTSSKLEYFQFAFNCSAAKALVHELRVLIKDRFDNSTKRLLAERKILDHLIEMWFARSTVKFSALSDLEWEIERLYETEPFWVDGKRDREIPFLRPIFSPLVAVLPKITEDIGLSASKVHWLACVDEAEFLVEPHLKCINEFLRSEKKPLVVKMATLPFKYVTRETLTKGVCVEPDGNDFNFRVVDHEADSSDFRRLTNKLLEGRLGRCELTFRTPLTLERFLGQEGNDELKDYFQLEMRKNFSEDKILKMVLNALSDTRRSRYKDIRADKLRVKSAYIKRFSPVLYTRIMRSEDSKGNRQVGWFAGASTVRRVSDGNPRRFIQLMYDIFEAAREKNLTPKSQHRIVHNFAQRQFEGSDALPEYGRVLFGLLKKIGTKLQGRVHADAMVDSGCNFKIQDVLLENTNFSEALKLGVAYSLIFCDEESLSDGLSGSSDLRLAYLCAVCFWLPMRKGDPIILRTKAAQQLFSGTTSIPPLDRRASDMVLKQMMLDFDQPE
jgi:hypothetical protein